MSYGKKNKKRRLVFWRALTIWLTADFFLDWFRSCFIYQTLSSFTEKNLEFRVLLIWTEVPVTRTHSLLILLLILCYLPLESTNCLQHLDQGITGAFRRYYTKHMFDHFTDYWKEPLPHFERNMVTVNIAEVLVVIRGDGWCKTSCS